MIVMWYGEFETDRIIRSYFPDMSHKGTFIEIGAARPDFLSLSRHFKESGWNTIGVEPNPYFAKLQRNEGNRVIECALANYISEEANFQILIAYDESKFESGIVTMESASSLIPYPQFENNLTLYKEQKTIKVKVRTLDHLLSNELKDVKKIDVISIDVEGGELEVLKGFTKKELYPYLFVIECLYENKKIEEILGIMGYSLILKHSYNHFYKLKEKTNEL
jgi:FkbM family methyltransferase